MSYLIFTEKITGNMEIEKILISFYICINIIFKSYASCRLIKVNAASSTLDYKIYQL